MFQAYISLAVCEFECGVPFFKHGSHKDLDVGWWQLDVCPEEVAFPFGSAVRLDIVFVFGKGWTEWGEGPDRFFVSMWFEIF